MDLKCILTKVTFKTKNEPIICFKVYWVESGTKSSFEISSKYFKKCFFILNSDGRKKNCCVFCISKENSVWLHQAGGQMKSSVDVIVYVTAQSL